MRMSEVNFKTLAIISVKYGPNVRQNVPIVRRINARLGQYRVGFSKFVLSHHICHVPVPWP